MNNQITLYKFIDRPFGLFDSRVESQDLKSLIIIPFLNEFSSCVEISNIMIKYTFGLIANLIINNKSSDSEEIKELIRTMFSIIFYNDTNNKYTLDIGHFFFNNFCDFIQKNFYNPNINNFAQLLMFSGNTETDRQYLLHILNKYLLYLSNKLSTYYKSHLILFTEYFKERFELSDTSKSNEEIESYHKLILQHTFSVFTIKKINVEDNQMELEKFKKISDNGLNQVLGNYENTELNILKEALQECFNDNMESFKAYILKMKEIYQNFIFYKCWEYKGKILGVHNEFGKHSLFSSNDIPSNYHCEKEDLIEILLHLIEIIEDFERI